MPLMAPRPEIREPKDLTPALDRLANAFKEGFVSSQDIQKRGIVGTTDAQAAKEQNKAAKATAIQDRLDQEGSLGKAPEGRIPGIASAPAASTQAQLASQPGPSNTSAQMGLSNKSTAELIDLARQFGIGL